MYELAMGAFFVMLLIGGVIGIASYFHLNGVESKEKDDVLPPPPPAPTPTPTLNTTPVNPQITDSVTTYGLTTNLPNLTAVNLSDAIIVVKDEPKPKKKRYYRPKSAKGKPVTQKQGNRKPIKKKLKG